MPISFVGVETNSISSSQSGITIDKPTGVDEGDVLVLKLGVVFASTPIVYPSGWTEEFRQSDGFGWNLVVAYKVAGASEPSSYTFTFDSADDVAVGGILAFDGVDDADPIFDSGATGNSNTSSLTSPTIADVEADQMHVALGAAFDTGGGTAAASLEAENSDGWTSPAGAKEVVAEDDYASEATYQLGSSDGAVFSASNDVQMAVGGIVLNIGEGAPSDDDPAAGVETTEEVNAELDDAETGSGAETELIKNQLPEQDDTGTGVDDDGSEIQSLTDETGSAADVPGNVGVSTATDTATGVDDDGDVINSLAEDFATAVDTYDIITDATPSLGTYKIYIDWDGDDGLYIGNFELNTGNWLSTSDGADADLSIDNIRAHSGFYSMKIDWNASTSPFVLLKHGGLTSGVTYTFSAWTWTPGLNGMAVKLGVNGVGSSSVQLDTGWVFHSFEFEATASDHVLQILPESDPNGTERTWVDQVMITRPEEDVTGRTLGLRQSLEFARGRDEARSISAITNGEVALELNNMSKDYSPDNPDTSLKGLLFPGKPLLITVTYRGHTWNLFSGYTDEFKLTPARDRRSIQITALDLFTKFSDVDVSTDIYPSIRTGDAINAILDEIDWPDNRRSIDVGASTLRWWIVDDQAAMDAIQDVTSSEGRPAFAYIDPSGNFIFKDRHHRLVSDKSKLLQGSFDDAGTEPTFSDFDYEIGREEIVNRIRVEIDERKPLSARGTDAEIYSSNEVFTVSEGETRTISVHSDDPFINAKTPTENTPPNVDPDYTVTSGSVNVSLSSRSGHSFDIIVFGNSDSVVEGMKVRATPIGSTNTRIVDVSDADSLSKYGERSLQDTDILPLTNRHDAESVAQTYLAQRAERLPMVHITVNSGKALRLLAILERELSDRIKIIEGQTFTDHEFFIENISHSINEVGYDHQVTFGCERIPPQESIDGGNNDPLIFTLDDPDRGFDKGVFGQEGSSTPAVPSLGVSGNLFIVGESDLGSDGLAY